MPYLSDGASLGSTDTMWTSILQLMHQEVHQVTLSFTFKIHLVLNHSVSNSKHTLLRLNYQHNQNLSEKMLYTVLYSFCHFIYCLHVSKRPFSIIIKMPSGCGTRVFWFEIFTILQNKLKNNLRIISNISR